MENPPITCACGAPAQIHTTTIERGEKREANFCADHPPAGLEREAAAIKVSGAALEKLTEFWEPRIAAGRCTIRPALAGAWSAGRQWAEEHGMCRRG